MKPTATQYFADAHDTRETHGFFVPLGHAIGLVAVHVLPFHTSATSPASPTLVPVPSPTATQLREDVHDTLFSVTSETPFGVAGSEVFQVLPFHR
jgi:hypothetical protein